MSPRSYVAKNKPTNCILLLIASLLVPLVLLVSIVAAALATGADMCSAFTSSDSAGAALRCMDITSGDVMTYAGKTSLESLESISGGLAGVCIGPGLGRSDEQQEWARGAVGVISAVESVRAVVVDADGLWPGDGGPKALEHLRGAGGKTVVITPNIMEYGRLITAAFPGEPPTPSDTGQARRLLESLGVTAMVLKGASDTIIMSSGSSLICSVPGSTKRCGGLGDVLSGILCVILGWYCRSEEGGARLEDAIWTACAITRESCRRAQDKNKRAMTAKDVLAEVPGVVEDLSPMKC